MRPRLSATPPPERLALDEAVWSQRHRWVTLVLVAHLPLLLAWSLLQGVAPSHIALLLVPTALWALAIGPALTRGRWTPPTWLASCAAAGGLMGCSAYLVSVSGDHIEAHFHFFVLVPVVALYEAWAPFLVAVGAVLVEHGVVGTFWPHAVFGHSSAHLEHPWQFSLIHAGFFAAASVGALVTWRLAEASRRAQQGLLDELQHRTRHDELTGLVNRTGLAEALDAALVNGPVAVVVMDLDRFKEVNDTLGHTAGDELLVVVASRMRAAMPPGGVLARLGGDEFAAVLPGAGLAAAMRAVEALRGAAGEPLVVVGTRASVEASAGVALHEGPGLTDGRETAARGLLLRQADVAMYEAKTARTGSAVYDPATDPHTAAHLDALDDLRRVVTGRGAGELVVHLQPKVSFADGRVVGAEALVRWLHPVRGLLPPVEFVPLAERSDLAQALTRRVLDLALDQCARWVEVGRALPIAVNVSPRCLLDPGLLPHVDEALRVRGLDPRLLVVEITEDAVIVDPAAATEVLQQLRLLGVATSVDDFGTGFSSLSYLRRLPIRELKIDRSFVTGLGSPGGEAADEVLVSSIIDLGHQLGMHVVAEGVETLAEHETLLRLGCDTGQGYLYSWPVPAEDFLHDLEGPGAAAAQVPARVPARVAAQVAAQVAALVPASRPASDPDPDAADPGPTSERSLPPGPVPAP